MKIAKKGFNYHGKEHMEMMQKHLQLRRHEWKNNPRPGRRKKIICYDIINNLTTPFIGISECSKTLNIIRTSIDNNLNGRSILVNKQFKFSYSC